jgi:hypothetical protein
MTINTCTQKWCFKVHRRTKEQKLKLKLQKNRLKNSTTRTKFYLFLQLQELQIIKSQYRNAHSNSRYRFRKTTLTRLLAKHFKWEPHYEDVVDNPYWMILPSNGTLVF